MSSATAPEDPETATATGFFLPPLTEESGLPPTLVRGPWTADLNSIRTSTVFPPTPPGTTKKDPVDAPKTVSDQQATPSTTQAIATAQTETTSLPVVGTRNVSTTEFWGFIAGAVALVTLGLIVWYIRKQRKRRRREIARNAARARHLQRSNSSGDAFSDTRTDATPRRDIGPSALRPLPDRSNFQKSAKRRLDALAGRETKIRWAGLSATTSEANANAEPPAASTTGRTEFFDASVRSDESEFDLIRRGEPINEAYRRYRIESRDRKLQEGHAIESAMSVSDFDSVTNDGPSIFVPDIVSPAHTARTTWRPPTPPLTRPQGARLRSEANPRRLQEIQPHELRLRSPTHRAGPTLLTPQLHVGENVRSRSASLVEADSTRGALLTPQTYGGREAIRSRAASSSIAERGSSRGYPFMAPVLSTASEHPSQADFGASTEADTFTETEISDDPWREEAIRNQRMGR
ncbi:hypothetical protein GP486_005058 [Trichoglossum hirsutum]|uniref:Uncharacterized protein n=1 Tax=Trichoglossum hirsutum TaxID=265104 RepID=A0A9P8L9W2_9PEZI|nr:hypothetical protein GP486_005058 [Trichoglossum hirsutum]